MEGAEGLELGREVNRRIGTPRVPKSLVAGGRHQPTTETPGTPQRARFDRTLQERGQRTYTRVSPWREAARIRPRVSAAPPSPSRSTKTRMTRGPPAARRGRDPTVRLDGDATPRETTKPSRRRRAHDRSTASRRPFSRDRS